MELDITEMDTIQQISMQILCQHPAGGRLMPGSPFNSGEYCLPGQHLPAAKARKTTGKAAKTQPCLQNCIFIVFLLMALLLQLAHKGGGVHPQELPGSLSGFKAVQGHIYKLDLQLAHRLLKWQNPG